MLRFSDLNRPDVFNVGYFIVPTTSYPANQNYPNYAYTNDYRVGYRMDSFLTSVMLDVPIGYVSAWDLLGKKNPHGNFYRDYDGKKPESDVYDRLTDWRNYGTVLGALSTLTTASDSSSDSLWTREHFVRHSTGRGRYQTFAGTDSIFRRDGSTRTYFGGSVSTTTDWNGYLAQRIYPDLTVSYSNGDFAFTPYKASAINYWQLAANGRFFVPILFDQIKRNVRWQYSLTVTNGYARNYLTWSEFDWSFQHTGPNSGVYVIKYKFRNLATKTGGIGPSLGSTTCTYDASVLIGYNFQPVIEDKIMLVGNQRISNANVTSFKRRYVLTAMSYDVKPPPAGYTWYYADGETSNATTSITQILETPKSTRFYSGGAFKDYGCALLAESNEKIADVFSDYVGIIQPRIRPAAALSSNDALSNYKSDSNFLESVPELPGLLRSVKDVSKLGRLLLEFKQGSPSAIPHLIDFLAESYLQFKYGLKPAKSDIDEVRSIVTTTVTTLSEISSLGEHALYGQFSYVLPHKGPFDSTVQVDVRSKMVIRSSPIELLGTALALDSVGLLPTLTRIWDLVPWSFVVDWFTSLSDRYQNIDDTLERVCLDVSYYVHTYTYKFYVPDSTVRPFTEVTGDVKPHYRVFLREKSRYHPVMSTSHYDFLPPRGLTKTRLLAAGSLLWVAL